MTSSNLGTHLAYLIITKHNMIKFPKPLIAIVGDSGSGKSYSLRNLDWNTSVLLDVERKGLPFPTDKFPEANYYPISGPADFDRGA